MDSVSFHAMCMVTSFKEDVHEDSIQFPSQNSQFLCNHPDGPLKATGRPAVSRSFSVEDVRTSKQHRLEARSSFSNSTWSWISAVDTKFLQDVRMLSSISEYSSVLFERKKEL
jgi:hypothetical protein